MKGAHLIVGLCLCLEAFAASPSQTDRGAESSGTPGVVFADDFENKKGWSLPGSFSIEAESGRNQTGALTAERKDAAARYEVASLRLTLEAEKKYKVSVWYRLENVIPKEGENVRAIDFLAVEFSRDGKYHSGRYHPVPLPQPTSGWELAEFEFTVPADVAAFLRFYLNRRVTGKIYIDDVVIRAVEN